MASIPQGLPCGYSFLGFNSGRSEKSENVTEKLV
jgi:hypothetical protein